LGTILQGTNVGKVQQIVSAVFLRGDEQVISALTDLRISTNECYYELFISFLIKISLHPPLRFVREFNNQNISGLRCSNSVVIQLLVLVTDSFRAISLSLLIWISLTTKIEILNYKSEVQAKNTHSVEDSFVVMGPCHGRKFNLF
jgi:hypothetical protein